MPETSGRRHGKECRGGGNTCQSTGGKGKLIYRDNPRIAGAHVQSGGGKASIEMAAGSNGMGSRRERLECTDASRQRRQQTSHPGAAPGVRTELCEGECGDCSQYRISYLDTKVQAVEVENKKIKVRAAWAERDIAQLQIRQFQTQLNVRFHNAEEFTIADGSASIRRAISESDQEARNVSVHTPQRFKSDPYKDKEGNDLDKNGTVKYSGRLSTSSTSRAARSSKSTLEASCHSESGSLQV